jgi:two-component system LytT family response regulator
MISCVIIEDEIAGQQILLSKISNYYPECEVLEIIDNKEQAVAFLNNNKVDLVFLDVQIKGGTGLDVMNEVHEKNFEAIFITAYDQYAIEALNASASYYILKPIRDLDFKKGMQTVLAKLKKSSSSTTILIPNKGSYSILKFEDIIYFESDGSYTKVLTSEECILSSKNLGYYEKILPAEQFIRPHHSYIVNLAKIQLLKKGRSGILEMKNGIEIPVSQRKMSLFLEYFID